MSDTAVVLIAAAVAVSVTELVCGPFLVRALMNRWAVARWMLAGLVHWHSKDWGWTTRLRVFLTPTPTLRRLCLSIGKQLDDRNIADNPHASHQKRPTIDTELFQVATGGGQSALYRLESDQMTAQINAAAEAVLDRPRKHPLLLITLAKLTRDEAFGSDESDAGPIAQSRFLSRDSTIGAVDVGSKVAEARHELTLRIQRRLDDLQITTRNHQHVLNQTLQLVTAVGVVAIVTADPGAAMIDSRVVALGAAGGFIAPLINRLVRRGLQ